MLRRAVIGLAILASFGSVANAQEDLLTELYGQGVHAYFSKNAMRAHELFSQAIDQGSRDPRVYYYRGFCYESMGRTDEADLDFQQGAMLETSGERAYPISKSLERIQGSLRSKLEKQRAAARLVAYSQGGQKRKPKSDAGVIRNPARDGAVSPEQSDPFKNDAGDEPTKRAPRPPSEEPAAPPMKEEGDPFGNQPEKAAPAAPAGDDPFGGDTKKPAPAPAPEKDDPFKDDKPEAGPASPAPASPAPAAPANPAPAPKKADDDPFGD